jgi:hypothetical protein
MSMILPSDLAYKLTKQLKISGNPLLSPHRELAEWINVHYDVQVLNLILDTIEPGSQPRLNVILERAADEERFRQKPFLNFDKDAQLAVHQQFASLTKKVERQTIDVSRLLVIFSAFERVARIEANQRVTDQEIETLKASLADPELWIIRTSVDGVTFFLYTDAQLKAHRDMGARDLYMREYSRLTEPYDEFGYLRTRGVPVSLDSKENFDTNYQSNWFYYYR